MRRDMNKLEKEQAEKLMESIVAASEELSKYHLLVEGNLWKPWPWFPSLRGYLIDAESSLEKVLGVQSTPKQHKTDFPTPPGWVKRIDIDDPRLKLEADLPIVSIKGLKYVLLGSFVANAGLQPIRDGEKTKTPIMDMEHAFHRVILDLLFEKMSSRGRGLNEEFFQMTVLSSIQDTSKAESAYIEDAKREASLAFSFKETMPKEFYFPYLTKHFPNPPRFNLVDGLWCEDKNGEYEDVFYCMEMVPFACSVRFKSLLPA